MGFEKFLKNKKAVIKISSIIFSLIAVTFLILFASGVFAGTHTSNVTISPLIVPNASSVSFNANVLWTGGPDPIHEFRVYQPLEFRDLNCDSVSGWYDPFYAYTTINGTEYYYCQWNAKTGNQLNAGNPEKDFTFSLNTAKTESCRYLYVETRDDHGVYVPHNPQICVDTSPPTTTKSFIGPYKYGSGPEEWIDGVTEIKLDAVDPQPHPSGVDKTWYMNMIDLTEDACWNPEEYCNPITEWPSQFLNGYSPRDEIECIDSAQEWCSDEMGYEPYTDDWYDCVEDYAYNECKVDPLWKLYRGVPFQKAEESCHLLQFFSVDKVGNVEDYKVNCFFVDKTPPEPKKTVGEPNIPCNGNGDNGGDNGDIQLLNSVGDEIATINFPEGGGTGVGVAFDGEFLYYTYISSKNLYKIRPDGSGHTVIETTGISETGLGALSYDATRDKIWAGTYGCDEGSNGPVYLIDKNTGEATYMFSVPSAYLTYCLDDGIAYDASDDSIWYSDDIADTMVHMDTDGTFLGTVDLGAIHSDLNTNSGIAIGGDNFYLGTNGKETTIRVDRNSLTILDTFVNTNYRIEDMECDPDTYSPTEVMWIRDAYAGSARAYEIEPGTCGLGGQPPKDDKCDYWVRDHVTPITLECTDQKPHPSGDEEVCYKVSYDLDPFDLTEEYCEDENLEEINQEGYEGRWCCVDAPKIVIFEEDSLHDLEYFCRDAVDKKSKIDKEWFKVDSQHPIINKTMIGNDYIGYRNGELNGDACPPKDENDVCYVADNGENGVAISVQDNTTYPECAVDKVRCRYELWWEGRVIEENSFSDYAEIIFKEDSTHILKIWCEDALGNEAYDEEEFLVDSTPPETIKTYGDPHYPQNINDPASLYPHWISTETPITLKSADNKVGVDKILWRNIIVPDQYCECNQCQNYEVSEETLWNEDSENETIIYKEETSCHLLEFYAIDKLGNQEKVNRQCVFVVNNSAPIPNKTIKEPVTEWYPVDVAVDPFDPDATHFYPWIVDKCWSENLEERIDCWKVTLDTKINMSCTDPQPHPQ